MKLLLHTLVLFGCLAGFASSREVKKDWNQFRGPSADGIWNPSPMPSLDTLRDAVTTETWQQSIGAGYAGVTVANGKVYVMDYHKTPVEIERVLCFDIANGKLLWSHQWEVDYDGLAYGTGPRASVTVHEGVAYALGALGHLTALNAESGAVLHTQDTRETLGAKPPQWGFAASPFIYSGQLFLHIGAEPEGTVVALDKATGKLLWRCGNDPAGYSTPVLVNLAGDDAIVQWTPEHVYAFDPSNGKLHWKFPYSIRYGVSIAQPIYQEGILLVSSYWHGTRALEWKQANIEPRLLWSSEDKLQGLMSQPLYHQGTVYLLDRNEGLCAFDLKTGELLWSDEHLLTPKDRNPQISLVWIDQSQGILGGLNAIGEWVIAQVNRDGIEEVARHQVSGKTWAHPAFTDHSMIVRTDQSLAMWKLW